MRAGFGALLTTDANLATMPPDESCCLFVLNDSNAKQDFSIVSKTGPALITNKFIELVLTLFRKDQLLKERIRI